MLNDFGVVSQAYAQYNSDARGAVRHELVLRRLRAEIDMSGTTVLDVGCGDGEMTLRLARCGAVVTGVDSSEKMLERAGARLKHERSEIRQRVGLDRAQLGDLAGLGTFEVVCCHGVLLYLDEARPAMSELAECCATGGLLSVLTKNALATGVRTALRGDYARALAEISEHRVTTAGNLGVPTRGDDPHDLNLILTEIGFVPLNWQGIRVFSDHLDPGVVPEADLADLINLEEAVSHIDPYRSLGRLVHVLGRR